MIRPRWYERLRLTRIGLYFYSRRFTAHFGWCIRWQWLPHREIWDESWDVYWGRWNLGVEWFDAGDDWGAERGETQEAIFSELLGDLSEIDLDTPG